jgi:hypothetical protein
VDQRGFTALQPSNSGGWGRGAGDVKQPLCDQDVTGPVCELGSALKSHNVLKFMPLPSSEFIF